MSRRASIISEILPYIDKDDWEKCDGFIVFGKEAFRAWETGPLTREEVQHQEVSQEVDGFIEKVRRQQGAGLAAVRTTLDRATRVDLTDALKDLRPKTLEVLKEGLEKAIKSKLAEQETVPVSTVEHPASGHDDVLDRHYAEEVISKLSRIVRLVSALEPMETGRNSVPAVNNYFADVHNCFLYGFNVACAVLCRALLEVALKERLEPRKARESREPSNQPDKRDRKKSKILKLLDRAKDKGFLDGSRVAAGERIKDAGDAAIHRLYDFQTLYDTDDKVWKLVDETRLVLEDLYRPAPAQIG